MRQEFLRHTPADPDALPARIVAARQALDAAEAGGPPQIIDCAGELVALLTAARREAEAFSIGITYLPLARTSATLEESAWLLHHLATAAQYCDRRSQANDLFAEALALCRQHGWRRLEHFVLHHWGRCRVEQGDFDAAQQCFVASRAVRAELGGSLVASSDRALAELAKLRGALHRTALAIVIPEAESRFGAMRRKFDPQANFGVPAHITILFPFMPPERVDAEVLRRLKLLFKRYSPFRCVLARVERFPATAYLAPTIADPFVELTNAVAREFPEYPPYGGAHRGVIPHLTIADGDAQAADVAELALRADIERNGPVSAHCGSVKLLENASGLWREMHEFALVGHQG